MCVRKMAREAPTTLRTMPAIQGKEIIPLGDFPAAPVQPVTHSPGLMATHPPSSSEASSPAHDSDIQPKADRAGDTSPPNRFHEWEMYPENLSDYNILDVNIKECHRRLKKSLESDTGHGTLVGGLTKVETLTMNCTDGSPGLNLGQFITNSYSTVTANQGQTTNANSKRRCSKAPKRFSCF